MSRIGKAAIYFDKAVQITVQPDNSVTVKGAKATQTVPVRKTVGVKVEDGKIILTRTNEDKETRALHGVYRSLIQNAVTGVTKGWSKSLDLVGVGYRANVAGKNLEMSLGYSHPIKFAIPDGIEIKVEKQTNIQVSGASRELVGQVAAKIRGYREPEPYLGKGVKYSDEKIRKKAGKPAGK
jgi:large subunit ribosomal protein L6